MRSIAFENIEAGISLGIQQQIKPVF